MTIATQLVTEINDGSFLLSGYYWLIQLLTLIAACLSAYFFPYFKASAINKANQENFDKILYQLKEQTSATKSIELSLTHTDWAKKENKVLRREKLETVVELSSNLLGELSDYTISLIRSENLIPQPPATSFIRFKALVKLYFPEAKAEFIDLQVMFTQYRTANADLAVALARATDEGYLNVHDSFKERFNDLYKGFALKVNAFNDKCADIMTTLIDPDM